MPDNKNQHFVPRALLKPFCFGEEAEQICLLNLRSGQKILKAPTKNQCSKDYFYGQDPKLEKAIQSIEGAYGRLRDEIIDNRIKLRDRAKLHLIKRFMLFQSMRTLASVRQAGHSLSLMREGMSRDPRAEIEEVPDEKTLTQFAMHAYVDNMQMIDDLSVCIVRSGGVQEFVVGDDPVVHINRWQVEKRNRYHFGPGHAGTIFVMPISPSITVLLYDAGVYSVRRNGLNLDLSRNCKQIEWFNQLQVCNALNNVYFGPEGGEAAITQIQGQMRDDWPDKLWSNDMHASELVAESEDYKEYRVLSDGQVPEADEQLVHVQKRIEEIPEWPSFLRFRSKPKFHDSKTGRGCLRPHTLTWHSGSDWVL